MVAFEAEVSQASIDGLKKALDDYQAKMGRGTRDALRSVTIDVVKSLRKNTRSAPKQVLRGDVRLGTADPKYLTRKGGGGRLRRVSILRWFNGMKVPKSHWQQVGTQKVRRRSGEVVEREMTKAALLREARKNYGGVRNWGLAKQSWGWFMKALFNQSLQDRNPKAKIDGRMVDKAMEERDGKLSITIVNRLDYIRKAMFPGAVEVAVRSALRSIQWKIQNLCETTRRRFGL